ncbi:MAG: cytochrome c biogenesis protein CcsA [Bacteroidota bacterium]
MVGSILIKLAFVTCLLSVALYFQTHLRSDDRLLKWARIFFHATVVSVMVTSAALLYLILTHQFQFSYVWSYSGRELSLPLLISTFYAGQEGSFLLWTLFTSLIGVFLLQDSSKKGYEPQVMTVYGLIELFLLLMLLVKNPFSYVWETWVGQVEAGFTPPDGRGLNPLLQNYWMVIHPQIMFSGFAAMGVPYAYAVAALMKRDYTSWIKPATPWLVFGCVVLGAAIMMGGFWAYETLGWGGYWGWDPVENSSLVPWLVGIAAIHTTLSQRKSGAFVKTNLVLSMLCFIFVLYSTFLTRSGVLGETSVHSFVDPGMWAYWLLVGMLVLFIGLGGGLLLWRRKEMPKGSMQHDYFSREFALFLGSAALVCAAIFVSVGTSSPLITTILQGKTTAVDISYYSTTTLPLGIAIGILCGLAQLLWWTKSNKQELRRNLLTPTLLSIVATGVLVAIGVRDVLVALFVFGAAFALFSNLQVGWRIIRGSPKFAGGSIAHIGLAVMFLGFAASSKYDEKVTLSLPKGETIEALGYKLTYVGYKPVDREKFGFDVHVEYPGKPAQIISPIMYYSEYTKGLMRNPDILNLISKDFYLAPLSLEQAGDSGRSGIQSVTLKRGETKRFGDVDIMFLDFDFPVMEKAAMLEGKDVRIGAKLQIVEGKKKPTVVTPAKLLNKGEQQDAPASYIDLYEFTIIGMHPDREAKENSTVEIGVRDLKAGTRDAGKPKSDVLVVEASIKPYINLVWNGVIILIVGLIVTIVRRSQEARMKLPSGEDSLIG